MMEKWHQVTTHFLLAGWLVLGLLFTDFVTSLLSSELTCPQYICQFIFLMPLCVAVKF